MQQGSRYSVAEGFQRPLYPGSYGNVQVLGGLGQGANPQGLQRLVSLENNTLGSQNYHIEPLKNRGHSPMRANPLQNGTAPPSPTPTGLLSGGPAPTHPHRPVSQALANNRSVVNPSTNDTGSVSNLDRRSQGPIFGPSKAFNYQRMDKETLREQIGARNRNVKELTNNKKFFADAFSRKTTEFKDRIRVDLKAKIFDKILKSNLHYIYKHYENFRAKIDPSEASKVLSTNIAKQNSEVAETKRLTNEIDQKNRLQEQRLLESANKIGLIKEAPELVENISRADIEGKIRELGQENSELERTLASLKKWKDDQLYSLKIKHEMKGRRLMEEKAIRLALQFVDPQDHEQLILKQQIEALLREIEMKHQSRKTHPASAFLAQRDRLRRELELLKFS